MIVVLVIELLIESNQLIVELIQLLIDWFNNILTDLINHSVID